MCFSPVAWMPEKTRMEVTSSKSWECAGWNQRTRPSARDRASPARPRPKGGPTGAGGNGHAPRIDEKAGHYTDCSDGHILSLDAFLLARTPRAAAAGVARRDRGCRRPRAAEGKPAAGLRRRGAQPAREPRPGDRGPRVPAPGRRLRRVVQRALDDAHPGEAQDHAADV